MPQKEFKRVFIFLDTEKHASAFDILTTIDALPDAEILKYENVTAEDAEQIVRDAMFPRGPEGAKYTKIFVNGNDITRINEVLDRIRKCMFPPFELAVLVDPRGAYTTASAAVAKTMQLWSEKGFGRLQNLSVAVLAGTGPVGQTAARLYASEKAAVIVTSRSLEKASALATGVNREFQGGNAQGVEAQTPEEVGNAIKNANIILSAGAAGAQLLPLNVLKEYGKKCRIVADVNAVPPLGIEGLDPNAEGEEVVPRVLGIGALAIGKLKNRVEVELIKRVAEESRGVLDYTQAFEMAKKIVADKEVKKSTSKTEPTKYWLP